MIPLSADGLAVRNERTHEMSEEVWTCKHGTPETVVCEQCRAEAEAEKAARLSKMESFRGLVDQQRDPKIPMRG
jgi:hypothetical protein